MSCWGFGVLQKKDFELWALHLRSGPQYSQVILEKTSKHLIKHKVHNHRKPRNSKQRRNDIEIKTLEWKMQT